MVDPKTLATIGATVVAVLTVLIATMSDKVKDLLWNQFFVEYRFPVYAVVLLIIFVWSVNYIFHKEKSKRDHLEITLAQAHEQLRQRDLLRFLDGVTGIPNESKLQADFPELTNSTRALSMIMMDLDGFGKINNRFGYEKGDEVIRYIASDTYRSMRRDENVYKIRSSPEAGLWTRIYRKYSGGDEFVFVLNGDEIDALGYLGRLKRRFDNDYTRHISNEILKHPWQLRFHAGLCSLEPGDAYDDAKKRAESCLLRAKQTGSTRRVVWLSNRKSTDFPTGSPIGRSYAEAEKEFNLE